MLHVVYHVWFYGITVTFFRSSDVKPPDVKPAAAPAPPTKEDFPALIPLKKPVSVDAGRARLLEEGHSEETIAKHYQGFDLDVSGISLSETVPIGDYEKATASIQLESVGDNISLLICQ